MTYTFSYPPTQFLGPILVLLPPFIALIVSFILSLVIWSLFWKGMALWKAAKNNQKGWFIALLVINTLSILEIIYLLAFQKKQKEKTTKSRSQSK